MKIFAPANKKIGFHWHHFNQPILPPIIDIEQMSEREIKKNKVMVYLPFEDVQELTKAFVINELNITAIFLGPIGLEGRPENP